MVWVRRDSATGCSSPRRTSADSTSSRRSPIVRWTLRPAWRGIEPAARAAAGCTSCTPKEQGNESDDTDVYVRYSDDDGATWSSGVRVNDDRHGQQPVPAEDLARSDHREPGRRLVRLARRSRRRRSRRHRRYRQRRRPVLGRVQHRRRRARSPRTARSAPVRRTPTTRATVSTTATTADCRSSAGVAHPAWADNSNAAGTNPDGALHQLDIYTTAVPIG